MSEGAGVTCHAAFRSSHMELSWVTLTIKPALRGVPIVRPKLSMGCVLIDN